jgi:hypothetical protein
MPQIPPFSKGAKLTQNEIYDYILAHLAREKNNNSVNLSKEYIGVGISGSDITELVAAGASDFIIFHAVEKDTDTVILVGVNAEGYMVKNNEGKIIAIERWEKFGPTLKEVDDNVNTLYNVFS